VLTALGPVSSGHGGHPHNPVSMTAGHLLAALVTAALLGYGEQLAMLILTWLHWLSPVILIGAPVAPRPARWVGSPDHRRPRLVLPGGWGVRGPPALSAP
jgi:hypothetical protein